MRKTTKGGKSAKTTGKKAAKTAPKATEKAPASTPATETAKTSEPQEKAEKAPKHPILKSGDDCVISEQVGVHVRCDIETAPTEGDLMAIETKNGDFIPLIVSCTRPLVDGKSILVQAFVTKGSGDYKLMIKGDTAKLIWK